MATSLFSPSWYRVRQLRPRLRGHVEIHRHDYRHRVWFVLQDHAAGRSHRLSPAAYRLVGLRDGKRTLQQLWDIANEQLAGRAPTQDETIRLLGQLHAADALIRDVPPDSRELFRRYQRQERQKVKQKIWLPLAVRIPLWDPDAFLTATMPFARPFFSRAVAVIWLLLLLFVIPAPHWTVADGVTWPSDKSQLRVGTNGFVTEIAATTGDRVAAGDPVIVADDPFLRARLELLKAQLKGLVIQRDAFDRSDRVQADLVRAEIMAARSDLARAEEQIAELVVRSPRAGTAVVPRDADLLGRYVQKGDLVGYVIDAADIVSVRVVIDQDDIDLVRRNTRSIKVMPVDWRGSSFPAELVRETPGGINRLPTPALGLAGGGDVAIDPGDPSGTQTLERVFEFEIRMPDAAAAPYLGRRIKVRFDHGYMPIGLQAYRGLRQSFLRLYNV